MTGASTSSSPRVSKELKTKQELEELVESYDNWLFDCDGVIWHDMELIAGVFEVLQYLRKKGKKLIFVTNNATKSREAFKAKFDKLGVEVHVDEIFGSAYASVAYLKYNLHFPSDKKVYVIGEQGMEHELASEGIQYTGGTDPADNQFFEAFDFSHVTPDPSVGAVMCGFDGKINYTKLAKANRYLRENKDCIFMLTNDDRTFPTASGAQHPGSGALSAPLRYCLPHLEPIVVGKPNKPFMDCITKVHQLDKKRTIMIGDRLDTDILFGINGGTASMMVLTGVNKLEDFEAADAPIKPDYYMNSLGDLKAVIE
ncbi:2-phosphoglycolate phosphatase [Cystobasidium minutum MCA 4210]|uniref:2-phosphoglycolate phosphatase n=1 Tax=Cystobasidium minutum MCA 4210 TaxID=1397322 RepID=UPI0034CDD255|eukprot:jgi/Rhomi1/158004/estExt_Genewise1Plus.C_2_t20160